MSKLLSCFKKAENEVEEFFDDFVEEGTEDPSLRCETNPIFSLYQSLLHELLNLGKADLRCFMSEEEAVYHETNRSVPNPIDILKQQHDRFKRFQSYLNEGVPNFYYKLQSMLLENYEVNSLDSVLSLIIIGAYYGTNSMEYGIILDGVFKDGPFDPGMFRIVLDNILNLKKKFHDPELGIDGHYHPESKDPNCYQLLETCKIAFVADWATGTKSSFAVLKSIASHSPEYFVHLGDVYYSGRISEHKSNLVGPIQKYLPNTRCFIIPGNHDYYSGSKGVKYSLKSLGQNASYFSLYNSKVQFEGLDTGFNDSNCFNTLVDTAYNTTVVKSENDWHQYRLYIGKEAGRKLCLLSHHMPVCPWTPAGNVKGKTAPVNPALWSQYSSNIPDVELWMYGHDHSFAIIDPYTYDDVTLKRPRLMGNGSCQYRENDIEEYMDSSPVNFETSDVPIPTIKHVYPGTKMSLLNPCYSICEIRQDKMIIEYYELPQVSVGEYDKAKILYTEIIYF